MTLAKRSANIIFVVQIILMDKDLHPGRNYLFGWKEAILLAVTFLFMQFLLAGWSAFEMFVLHDNPAYKDYFIIVSYVLTFTGCIFAFDQFIVKPTGSRLSFNMRTSPFSTYLLVFPLMIGGIFIAEYTSGLLPTTGDFFNLWYEQVTGLLQECLWAVYNDVNDQLFRSDTRRNTFRGIIQKGLINKGFLRPMRLLSPP